MLSIESMTIDGYLIDGDIVCRACGEKRKLPASKALTRYELRYELESSFAGDGLACADCFKEIVEGYVDEK